MSVSQEWVHGNQAAVITKDAVLRMWRALALVDEMNWFLPGCKIIADSFVVEVWNGTKGIMLDDEMKMYVSVEDEDGGHSWEAV